MGPHGEKTTLKEKFTALKDMIPVFILFIIVLGGIYSGFVSTTESGAIGTIGAVVIALATKQLTWKKLYKCLLNTAMIGSAIFILMAGTFIFSSFLTLSNLPQFLAKFAGGLDAPRFLIILVVMLIYIIMGMFMPDNPIVVLTVPILYPVMVTTIGVDPIWFGVFIVFMVALAQISPPVGMVVYYLAGLTDVPVNKVFKGVMPFLAAMIVSIVLIIAFPLSAHGSPQL